jgi:hypothetical protein
MSQPNPFSPSSLSKGKKRGLAVLSILPELMFRFRFVFFSSMVEDEISWYIKVRKKQLNDPTKSYFFERFGVNPGISEIDTIDLHIIINRWKES